MNQVAAVEFYLVTSLKDRGRPWLGLTAPQVRARKPTIRRGEIALRFELRLPASLFKEFIPSGVIEIPEGASIGRPALRVEVPDQVDLSDPAVRLQLVPIEE